jgi:ABC-type phosphate/phosphonate transport system substrate-binding protein
MIACLPMYDWPQVRAETDRYWALIRDALAAENICAPAHLSRDPDLLATWQNPGLLLAQTCGMPYRTLLHGRVKLVGTPDYGLPDIPAGYYYSELVAHVDAPGNLNDFIGRRLAINGFDSQSGWAAPQNHASAAGGRFTDVIVTGAHLESARAVADGRADIAGIDAVTWRLIRSFEPRTATRLRSLGQTVPTPGLPLITSVGSDHVAIARAVSSAIAALSAGDRTVLGLNGLALIEADAYLAIPTPPAIPAKSPSD